MVGYKVIGNFFNTTPLSFSMHMTALGLGLGSWAICALIKLTGPKLVNAMPEFGEDKEALHRARAYSNRASNAVSFKAEDQDSPDKEALHRARAYSNRASNAVSFEAEDQ